MDNIVTWLLYLVVGLALGILWALIRKRKGD